jgi:nitrate reductase molybdenum cofactor assembly chaperone NarJ/NarW
VNRPVGARAASLLLRYPDPDVLAVLPTLCAALSELPMDLARPLWTVAAHRSGTDPTELAEEYVRLFDFRRRCCLHLTYYTCGDTRKRGEALVDFAAAYRDAGLAVADGELPDYLPAVLDLAAEHDNGWKLLRTNRIGVDLLAKALADEGSVYVHAVEAVQAMLPPPAPADLAAALGLARTGPPAESVGLEPYR